MRHRGTRSSRRLIGPHIAYRNFNGDGKINTRVDGVREIYLQDPDGSWIEVNDAKYE
jgi:lactoylglutathione lyase